MKYFMYVLLFLLWIGIVYIFESHFKKRATNRKIVWWTRGLGYPLGLFIFYYRYLYKLQFNFFSTADGYKVNTAFYILWLVATYYLFTYFFIKFISKFTLKRVDSNRRDFVESISTTALSFGVSALAINDSRKVIAKKVEIPVKDKEFAGIRIAQISDLHVGPTIDHEHLEKCLKPIREFNPDILILTGDMVDATVSLIGKELMALADINPRLGKYYVTGNHEYYWGAKNWIKFFREKIGAEVLDNRGVSIDVAGKTMAMCGVYDHKAARFIRSHKPNYKKAIAGLEHAGLKILLAHRPRACFEAHKNGFDIQFSGHTHGGQSFPLNFIVGLVQPYLSGLNDHNGMKVYVSTGAGYWGPPARWMIPPSVDLITLKN